MIDIKQVIEKHKDTILLAEIGALIHDLGKLGEEFIGYESKDNDPITFYHNRILDSKYISQTLIDTIDAIETPDLLIKNNIKILRELIENHHGGAGKSNFIKYLKAPGGVDGVDSGVDKGTPGKKQTKNDTFIATAFGHENQKIILDDLKRIRNDFCIELENQLNRIIKAQQNNQVIPWNEIKNGADSGIRASIFKKAEWAFLQALGETRRASNDVTLWDHSYSVVALYKATLAGILLNYEYEQNKTKFQLPESADIKWKILAVNFDSLGFVYKGLKIGDIKGRRKTLDSLLDGIKRIIELDYPVGNEIYKDERGIYFVLPDLEELPLNDLKKLLKEQIIQKFQVLLDGEVIPDVKISKHSRSLTELSKLVDESKNLDIPILSGEIPHWKKRWDAIALNGVKSEVFDNKTCKMSNCRYYNNKCNFNNALQADVCPVCGVRPKCERQDLCKVCVEWREGRTIDWVYQINNGKEATIWLDEISDINDKVAIIYGQFNITKWLSGECLNTIFSQSFEDVNGKTYEKNKNFTLNLNNPYSELLSKLTVPLTQPNNKWEEFKALSDAYHGQTTKEFVEKIVKDRDTLGIVKGAITGEELALFLFKKHPSPARLRRICGTTNRFWESVLDDVLSRKDVYEEDILRFKAAKRDWLRKLRYNRLHIGLRDDLGDSALYEIEIDGVKTSAYWDKNKQELISIYNLQILFRNKKEEENEKIKVLKIRDPNKNEWKDIEHENIKYSSFKSHYVPFIDVFQSSVSSIVIVPGSIALNIVSRIKEKYETEFGKVRNRLPLHLGITYFHRKTPLYMALDASRRMFRHIKDSENWRVVSSGIENINPVSKKVEAIRLVFDKGINPISHIMDVCTADRKIIDNYYPYFAVNSGENLPARQSYFETFLLNNKEPIKMPLIHAMHIQRNDEIIIFPSFFDFEFVDSSSKRFGIVLNEKNKRDHPLLGKLGPRPYYLEEIDYIEELRKYLVETEDDFKKKNTTSQLHNFRTLIASKIEEWGVEDRATLEKFVEDSIIRVLRINRTIMEDEEPKENPMFEFVKNSVLSGLFFDMMEIYHSITKILKEERE
ncbi:MAG: CRISPR-associated protein Csx11 [Candidatus Methanoperedens sp.]|nr:CRISPR-associated protein Csx11 [Candidatus Methanoperedens sp.]